MEQINVATFNKNSEEADASLNTHDQITSMLMFVLLTGPQHSHNDIISSGT